MSRLDKIQEQLPIIKILPGKVDNIQLELNQLKHLLLNNYMTFSQSEAMNQVHRVDIENMVQNMNSRISKDILQIVDQRVPYPFLKELTKHKASLDNIKFIEKNMMKLSVDVERMYDRVSKLECLNKQNIQEHEERSQVEIEKLVQDKEKEKNQNDFQKQFELMDASLKTLFSNIKQIEQKTEQNSNQLANYEIKKQDSSRLLEQKQIQDKVKQQEQPNEQLVKKLTQKVTENIQLQNNFQKQLQALQEKVQGQDQNIKDYNINTLQEEVNNRFKRQQEQIENVYIFFKSQAEQLSGQFKKQMDNIPNQKSLQTNVDSLLKRIVQSENSLQDIQHENQLIKAIKTKQIEKLENQIINMDEFLQNKLMKTIAGNNNEQRQNFLNLQQKVQQIEEEIQTIKGPFLDEVTNLKNQNEGILRELNRLQNHYRELLSDYLTILQTKFNNQHYQTEKIMNDLQSNDDLIRNSTINRLKQYNEKQESTQNCQLLKSNNSTVSLGTEISTQVKTQKSQYIRSRARITTRFNQSLINGISNHFEMTSHHPKSTIQNSIIFNQETLNQTLSGNGEILQRSQNFSQTRNKTLIKKRTKSQITNTHKRKRNNESYTFTSKNYTPERQNINIQLKEELIKQHEKQKEQQQYCSLLDKQKKNKQIQGEITKRRNSAQTSFVSINEQISDEMQTSPNFIGNNDDKELQFQQDVNDFTIDQESIPIVSKYKDKKPLLLNKFQHIMNT